MVVAGALAGCGSSSTATRVTGAHVTGTSTYRGSGYSISVPSGWRQFTVSRSGRSLEQWGALETHSNLSVDILTGIFRSSATQLESYAKGYNRSAPVRDRATTIRLAGSSVPGAKTASILTIVKPNSSPPDATKELIVTTRSGREYAVTAERVGSGAFYRASFDGTAFLKSFRLTGGA